MENLTRIHVWNYLEVEILGIEQDWIVDVVEQFEVWNESLVNVANVAAPLHQDIIVFVFKEAHAGFQTVDTFR